MLLLVLALDGALGTLDGILLLIVGVGYTFRILRTSRREPAVQAEYEAEYFPQNARRKSTRLWLDVLSLLVGIAIIVLGAALLVDGAVDAARSLGVSDAVIGLTIVAIGTSAPNW